MTYGGPDQEGSLPGLSPEQASELAQRHGMAQVGVRPPLRSYIADVWRHRSFLLTMSSAEFVSRNQQNHLGQLWAVLNPLLLGAAYYLIFGKLLKIDKGIENYVPFLIIGLFSFIFIAAAMTRGSKALIGNMGLVRALRFPRVVLPISVVLTELFATLPAFAVAAIVTVLVGGTITWSWLLYPVAIGIAYVMATGIAMIFAVLIYQYRDATNIIPLLTRMLRYTSGVFFLIPAYATGLVGILLAFQPVAVALTILRQSLMNEYPLVWVSWAVAAGWALLLVIIGFVMFWRAEATYGRQ